MRKSGLVLVFGFLCAAVLRSAPLDIRADKLVYLDRGETAVFRGNVIFSKEGFRGRAAYLKLSKKAGNLRASGKIYSVFKSTPSKWVELWTQRLKYSETSDRLSSPVKSKFAVHVSTAPGLETVYEIICGSFYGFVSEQSFYLKGKPVTIESEDISGLSDFVVFSEGIINMSGNACVRYGKKNPYEASADFISINLDSNRVNFRKSVRGVFYAGDAESK